MLADFGSRMTEAVVRNRAALEARAARIEAELAIKARSEFLANMNHELRTPLNAIIGFATMLRDKGDYDLDEEHQRAYAEYILQSADLLLGHINTILEVAALESGRVELRDDTVELGEVLEAAMERAKVRADAAGVTITRRDNGDVVDAWGDANRIGQAVDHLLQAAIKACHEGGRVLVRACTDETDWAEIAIRDDGVGYSAEELKDALEVFKEMHRGLDRSFSGPGVGYAVAKTFVEMQGGRFRIKSRQGQGTLVRIELPLSNECRKTPPVNASAEEKADDGAEYQSMERTHDAA